MKKLFLSVLTLGLILGFTGCSEKNRAYSTGTTDPYITETFNEAINEIADQLLQKSTIKADAKVAIITFVDLHSLNKTTHFGRKVSESMFDELHERGFHVTDIRGSKTIRVNGNGEFFITRNIKLLDKKVVSASYILVGTYSKFGKGILLNVRILDNLTGDVVSTARTIININQCDVYENCTKVKKVIKPVKKAKVIVQKRTIGISDAGCSKVTCAKNCFQGNCGYKY